MKLAHLLALVLFFSLNINADIIDPIDDEDLAHIQLSAPADAPSGNGEIKSGNLQYSVLTVQSVRVQPGNYCLTLTTLLGNSTALCGVQLAPRQVLKFPMLQHFATVQWDMNADFFTYNFGKPAQIAVSSSGRNKVLQPTGGKAWLEPGNYSFDVWNPTKTAKLVNHVRQINAGAREVVDLTPATDPRLHLTFLPPQRAYDSIVRPSCYSESMFLLDRSNPRDPNYVPDLNEPNPYDVYRTESASGPDYWDRHKLWQNPKLDYSLRLGVTGFRRVSYGAPIQFFLDGIKPEITVNNIPYVMAWAPGKAAIQIKRIDVNHVTVTREDGTQYVVPGAYSVFVKTSGGWTPVRLPSVCSSASTAFIEIFKTKTGLDVPPAEYKVTVKFTTEEGPQQKDYFLDLR